MPHSIHWFLNVLFSHLSFVLLVQAFSEMVTDSVRAASEMSLEETLSTATEACSISGVDTCDNLQLWMYPPDDEPNYYCHEDGGPGAVTLKVVFSLISALPVVAVLSYVISKTLISQEFGTVGYAVMIGEMRKTTPYRILIFSEMILIIILFLVGINAMYISRDDDDEVSSNGGIAAFFGMLTSLQLAKDLYTPVKVAVPLHPNCFKIKMTNMKFWHSPSAFMETLEDGIINALLSDRQGKGFRSEVLTKELGIAEQDLPVLLDGLQHREIADITSPTESHTGPDRSTQVVPVGPVDGPLNVLP